MAAQLHSPPRFEFGTAFVALLTTLALVWPLTSFAGSSSDLPEVPIRRTRLQNGLRIVLSADLSSDRVGVCMTVGVGARNDPPDMRGLAALVARASYRRGSALTRGEYFTLAQSQGGQVQWEVNHERSQFCGLYPVHALDLALWLEAQRIQPVPATAAELEAPRRISRQEYLTHITQTPLAPGRARLRELVFGSRGAYSAPVWGRMKDLADVSTRAVNQHLSALYGPANAVLTIVGRFEVIPTLRSIHDRFESLPKRPESPPTVPNPGRPQARATGPVTVEDGNAGSMALVSGWVVPFAGTRARHALELAGHILGAGIGSRLWQRLVVDEEVAVWTRVVTTGQRGPGLLRIESAMEESSEPELALRLVSRELQRLAERGPREAELSHAKKSAQSRLLREHEGELNLAKRLGDYELGWNDARKGWGEASGFMKLSADEVRAAVAKYLTPARRSDVIVLPARTRAGNLGASLSKAGARP